MRTLWAIVVVVIVLTIGMLGLWASVLKNSGNILEFGHPSRDIAHSIDKRVFIDTLYIISTDTIKTNRFARVDILAKSSWIERMPYWKSRTIDLDSIGFHADTIVVRVNFKSFANGKPWAPDHGYFIAEMRDENGNDEGVYIDDHITQVSFKFEIHQMKDTIRLTTENGEKVVLAKKRSSLSHQKSI